MKLRSRSALPPLDKTARLPLVLGALLAGALVIQFAVGDDVELPLPGPIGRGGSSSKPAASNPGRSDRAAVILARSMFAPSGGSSAGGAGQIGSRKIVGSIRVGRASYAVVQGPDGRTASVPVGGRIDDWRVRTVRANEVLLARGEEKIIVPFGAGTPLPANAAATGSPR